jgi:hypothetical protein
MKPGSNLLRPTIAALTLLALGASGVVGAQVLCRTAAGAQAPHACCCAPGSANSCAPAKSPARAPSKPARSCCTMAPQNEAAATVEPPAPGFSLACAIQPLVSDPIPPAAATADSHIRSGDPPGTPAPHTVLRI